MYTVVIAESKILRLFEEYGFLLAQIRKPDEIALVEWNPQAESITSMTQDLKKYVSKKTEWRAVVVTTEGQEQINPFDFVQYSDKVQYKKRFQEKYLRFLREERFRAYEKAAENPLMKLAYALCGSPVSDKNLMPREKLAKLRSGQSSYGELMLEAQLAGTDITGAVQNLKSYGKDDAAGESELCRLLGSERAEKIVPLLEHRNAHRIAELLNCREISELLRLMNRTTTVYGDPLYLEQMVEDTYRHELLEPFSGKFRLQFEKPKEVICVAYRTADTDNYVQAHRWIQHDEMDYSDFSRYNLYSDALKFILMDVHEITHEHYDYDMLRCMSFIMLLAGNPLPLGVLEKNRVYRAEIEDDPAKFRNLLEIYDDKLRRTASALKERQKEAVTKSGYSIDTKHLMKLVETPVNVPVVTNHTYTNEMMTIPHGDLGFARDCPANEQRTVLTKYKDVRRNFISFLRQPRQALTQASEDMRSSAVIDDESALYLDEFECENIYDNAHEAEDLIFSVVTDDIYNNAKYQKQMEDAKKEVESLMAVRISRRAAVIGGLLALATFFVGFIPLLLSSTGTLHSWIFAVAASLSAVGALFAVGVWSLWRMRRKLIRKITEFNDTMRDMVHAVNAALGSFAVYLTHVCSFMRAQSVLNFRREKERKEVTAAKILQKHIQDIEAVRGELRDAFGRIEYKIDDSPEAEVYEFDFTLPIDYTYDLPAADYTDCYLEYIQEGNRISVPVYFINRILLRREELYD